MKKIIFAFTCCLALSKIIFAQNVHYNPGQDPARLTNFGYLSKTEIGFAKSELPKFRTGFASKLNCADGFSISQITFSAILTTLGMATPCIGTKCYSIRIYPAYDGNAMYLVFMGESYINGTDDKPETMLNNNFYKIISDDSKDLEIVPPSDRQKTIDEIKDFQTLYGKSSLFNLKSLVFDVSEYLTMKRQFGQNPQHSEGSGKQFWFRLRPAYNKLSLSTNKLYFVVNEEEITFGDNGAIYKRLLDDVQTGNSQYWYNHMEPCPDKCPLIEIEN